MTQLCHNRKQQFSDDLRKQALTHLKQKRKNKTYSNVACHIGQKGKSQSKEVFRNGNSICPQSALKSESRDICTALSQAKQQRAEDGTYRYVYLIFLRRQRQRPDNTRRRRRQRRSRLRCGSIAFRHPWVQFYNSALEDRPFDNVEWSFDSTTSVRTAKCIVVFLRRS